MNKKICALLIALSPVSLLLSGCGYPTVVQNDLVVESQVWIGWDVGDYEPAETTTYEDLYEGLVVYDASEALKIVVKSVSYDKVTLAFGGDTGVVEENPDGTIDLGKDPLKELDIKSGQTVKLATQTMDAGTIFTISYSK